MGQTCVMLIKLTITRQSASARLPAASAKCRVTFPVRLFRGVGIPGSPRVIRLFTLLSKHGLITPPPMSTQPLPVSAFLLRPALCARSGLNANGQSLFPLCSTCRPMCHLDWRRIGGANLQTLTSGASSVERHSSKALCPFSCLPVKLSVRRCQRRRRVDHTLFPRPARVGRMTAVKYGRAIRVYFLSSPGCGISSA